MLKRGTVDWCFGATCSVFKRVLAFQFRFRCKLNVSLESLTRLPNKSKARLIRGLSETASADGKLVANEIELLRAVATTLDCPMPLVA